MDELWLTHLENLAGLDLNEDERSLLSCDLTRIIKFAADLPALSEDVSPESTPTNVPAPIKQESVSHQFSRDDFITMAPQFTAGFLETPPVLKSDIGDDND